VWSAKNLDVDHYQNGDSIPEVRTGWGYLTTGAWCYFENNSANGTTYGKLYNWYAINDSRGLIPAGWHIATDEEWKTLEKYLGMTQAQADGLTTWRGTNEGDKLKEIGTTHWASPNNGTNISGFTALPNGHRAPNNDNFIELGSVSWLWTDSEYNSSAAYNRGLQYNYSTVWRSYGDKSSGYAIRLVSDYTPPDTIVVCNQVWQTRNLDVTKYRDGTTIPQITDPTDWANATTGAWCYYNNDSNYNAIYGKLYNWYAVNDPRGLAPEGWKIPTDDDWKELEMCLGMSQSEADRSNDWRGTNEGSKIKETGIAHWSNPNNGSTNESQLSFTGTGHKPAVGTFLWFGIYGYCWTKSEYNTSLAWNRYFKNDNTKIYKDNPSKKTGLPVRCLRGSDEIKLDSGLVAFYPFCGTARDESGNNNHGTVNGATLTTDRDGNANSAYSFDGNDDWINIQSLQGTNFANSFTITVWSKRIGTDNSKTSVFSTGGASHTRGLLLQHRDNGFQVEYSDGSVPAIIIYNSTTNTYDGNWHHFVYSYDETTQRANIYVDNVNVISNYDFSSKGDIGTDSTFCFGRLKSNPWSPQWLYGYLDDAFIYNRALNSAEIDSLYKFEVDCSIYTSITTGSVNSAYCVGETIRVPYTANGTYNGGNVFTAQLSDASGNFASPTVIGNLTSTSSGTITGTIPGGIQGSGFRVRVVSSNPAITGSDNGVNITINPLPTPQITTGQATVCARNQYPYTGNTSAGCTNKWTASSGTISGADDGTIVNVIWGTVSSGTVTLTQTNSTTGCKDSFKLAVTINPLPVPQITGTATFCKGQTGVYKSNTAAGLSYLWKVTNGTIVGESNRDSVIVTWDTATTGVIKLVQTTSDMCTDSTERNITVNPLPVVTFISAPNQVCELNTYKYFATPQTGASYNWAVSGGTIDAGQGSSTLTVTWGAAGVGDIKLTETYSATGCLDSTSRPITINPLPDVAINGTETAALDETEDYIAVNKTNLINQWEVTGGTIQGSSTDTTVKILWSEIGVSTLKLIQTDINTGCIDSVIISVTVLENPAPDITLLDSACENNESSYRTAYRKDLVYEWKANGGTITSPNNETLVTVRWGQAGTGNIKVVVFNTKLSKYDSVEKVIAINPLPKPQVIAIEDSAYTGSTMKYWKKPGTVESLKWKVTKGSIVGADNKDTVDVKWNSEGKGIIKLIATNQTTGCSDSTEKEIYIRQKAGLRIYGRTEVCENDTASYTTDNVSGATNKWYITDGTIDSETNTKINVTWGTTGTGKVKLVQDNQGIGIKDSTEIDVTINPLPNVTLNDLSDLCYKDTNYTLTGGNPPGGTYYFDDTVRTTFNPTRRGVGQHNVRYEYTDNNGCTNYAEKTFEIQPVPETPTITESGDSLTARPGEYFEWYYEGELIPDENDSILKVTEPGIYSVKAISNIGCESGESVTHYYPEDSQGAIISGDLNRNFGTIQCEYAKWDTIKIQNQGTEILTISEGRIEGRDKGDFRFRPQFAQTDIQPKGRKNYIIEFSSNTTGSKEAEVVLISNAVNKPEFRTKLTAKKDSIGFMFNDTIVKFEYVEENKKHFSDIKLINTGTIDLFWQVPIKVNNDFDIVIVDPNPTPANNGESDVTVRFNGGAKNYKTLYDYLLSEENCGRTLKLKLEAIVGDKPVDAMVLIRVDSSIKEYKPGEIVEIPIYLENSKNLNQANITGFTADFVYNATMLVPTTKTPMGTRENDIRTIPLTLPVNPIFNDVLQVLEFTATLGNDTTTTLVLENLKTIGDSIQINKIDGRFTLAGVCMEGGVPRLINTSNQIQLKLLKPNPTENKLTIDYELIETGQTDIYIMNTFGERIKTIVSKETRKGIYSIDADLSDIGSGLYFIILETPTVRKAEKVEIVK